MNLIIHCFHKFLLEQLVSLLDHLVLISGFIQSIDFGLFCFDF